jgi:hypothetical protein
MSMLCPRCQAGNHFFRQLNDEGDWWCRFCGTTVYAIEVRRERAQHLLQNDATPFGEDEIEDLADNLDRAPAWFANRARRREWLNEHAREDHQARQAGY